MGMSSILKSIFSYTASNIANPMNCSARGKCELETAADILQMDDDEISILRNLRAAKTLYEENKQLRETMEEIANAAQSLMWRKNRDGIYEYCNSIMCDVFFRLPKTCHNFVIGRSDIDLINYFREKTGQRHTFGELCVSTDEHCIQQGVRCVYLEMGWVDKEPLLLSVRKVPLFSDDGTCIGTVGVGVDVTYKCDELVEGLFRRIKEGEVEQLAPGVFWIKKEERSCRYLLPGELPDYDKHAEFFTMLGGISHV